MNESTIYRIQEVLGMKDREMRCKLCRSFNLSEPQFLICKMGKVRISCISLLVRVLQRNRANTMYVCIYKELVHVIIEADKSPDMQSASWRPRRANGVVPVWVQRPENQGSWRCSSSLNACRLKTQKDVSAGVLRQERTVVPAQCSQAEVPFYSQKGWSFCSILASTDWMRPSHIEESNLLY